jgi:hypothetical protein
MITDIIIIQVMIEGHRGKKFYSVGVHLLDTEGRIRE